MKTIVTVTERVTHTYDSATDITETSTSTSEQKKVLVSFDELNDTQREKAYEMWREDEASNPYFGEWTTAEITDTLEALVNRAGFILQDYRVDLAGYSFLTIAQWTDYDYYVEERLQLRGKRALAWLENVVLGPLRVPWNGPDRKKYSGPYQRPGMVRSCPLTGVCYDEDALAYLRESLTSGMTVKEAICSLAWWAARAIESEQEWALSETAFSDESNGGGREWEISEDGTVLGMV